MQGLIIYCLSFDFGDVSDVRVLCVLQTCDLKPEVAEVPASPASPKTKSSPSPDRRALRFGDVCRKEAVSGLHHHMSLVLNFVININYFKFQIIKKKQYNWSFCFSFRGKRQTKEWQLEDRLRLWQQSQPMERIDMFISHTWLAASRSKFWYLLTRRGWCMSFLLWLMTTLVAVILGACQMFPMTRSLLFFEGQWQEAPSAGFWILGFSLLAQVLGLCWSPRITAPSTTTCFVDLMSINQADEDSVKRGIRSIGILALLLSNGLAPSCWVPIPCIIMYTVYICIPSRIITKVREVCFQNNGVFPA